MTLNQIREEIGVLGFESVREVDDSFVFALRRALSAAYTERAVIREHTLLSYPSKPDHYVKMLVHNPDERIILPTEEGTYAFYAVGAGEFEICSERGSRTTAFSEPYGRLFCGRCDAGELRFSGRGRYVITSLTLRFGDTAECGESTVYSDKREIRLADVIKDLGSVIRVTDGCGDAISGAYANADFLTLPSSFCGEVKVVYRAAPPAVSADSPDTPIDICRELVHLIPLLTAAYFWLDDDAEKSGYYLSLYREGMNDLKRNSSRTADNEYTDPRGWS